MKTPKFNRQHALFFSLVLLTPLSAVADLVRAANVNPHTSEVNTKNSIDFSQNLGEKLNDGFLLAKGKGPKRPFILFDDGPSFVESQPSPPPPKDPKPDDPQSYNISAVQTFESLLG